MKKLSYLVLAATILSVGVSAAPAFAAPAGGTGVLSCTSGVSSINSAKHELAQELQLRTKLTPTIDEWNNCLKVQYTDANGHTNVALYDPSTLDLVNQLS